MRWIEAKLKTESQKIDNVCIDLENIGVGGMVIEDENDFCNFLQNNKQYWDYVDEDLEQNFKGKSLIKFYLADDEEGEAIISKVLELGYELERSYVEDSDWENNWREHYVPIEIGERLTVIPEWDESDIGERVALRLDPGLIFGTGSHATTRMCLEFLQEFEIKGKKVLDLGCGSGILGIGAIVLGADFVCGCDIDPKAPEVALSNATLNNIDESVFKIYDGDILNDKNMRKKLGNSYDIVLANIVSDVIIPLSGIVSEFMAEDSIFICSGIIEGRQNDVQTAIENAGFKILQHKCSEEWHSFAVKRA